MPITIRNADITYIYKAFQALDGCPKPVEIESDDGKKRTMLHVQPYSFSGTARLSIARWIARLKISAEALSKTHDDLVKQYASPGKDKVDEDKMPAWREQWTKVQEQSEEFTVEPIAYGDLKPEDNKLPGSVLGMLLPLLTT